MTVHIVYDEVNRTFFHTETQQAAGSRHIQQSDMHRNTDIAVGHTRRWWWG